MDFTLSELAALHIVLHETELPTKNLSEALKTAKDKIEQGINAYDFHLKSIEDALQSKIH